MFLPSCFSILLCVMTCLSLTLQKKNFKTSRKMFQCPGSIRKNFIPGNFSWRVAAETSDASCFKKGLLEKQQCSKHLHHIAIEKDILSEFSRCIFQVSLKYIKLVIPKILFILVSCSFNFYLKIMWPPPPQETYLPNNQQYKPPSKINFLTPPQQRLFWKFQPPHTQAGGGECPVCLFVFLFSCCFFVWYIRHTKYPNSNHISSSVGI